MSNENIRKRTPLYLLLFLALFIIAFSACKVSNMENEILRKTIEWNTLNNTLDEKAFEKMLAPNVVGYGKFFTPREFVTSKKRYLSNFSDFTQSIISDLTLTVYEGSLVRCDFTKRASFNGKVKNYASYLIFDKINGEYLITEEGDEITNSNLGYKPNLPPAKKSLLIPISDIKAGFNWTNTLIISGVIILSLLIFFIIYRQLFKKPSNLLLSDATLTPIKNSNSVTVSKDTVAISSSKQAESTYSQPINVMDAKQKGDAFEQYIIRCFTDKYFKVIDWRSDKGIDGRYPESNKHPDLVFSFKAATSEGEFAVECKYRQKVDEEGYVELCYSEQLSRYKEFARKSKMPVFIALGVGGTPDYPDDVYVIPLGNVIHHKMDFYEIKKFKKYSGRAFFFDANDGRLR